MLLPPALTCRLAAMGLIAMSCLAPPPCPAADLLPDLFSWAHDVSADGSPPNLDLMHGGRFDTTTIKNRVLYRFNAALTNIGAGPLQVIETTHEVGGQPVEQTITQQILQEVGGFRNEVVGTFPYPPEVPGGFGHLRLPGLAQYNILAAIPNGDGEPLVGELLTSNDKLSMGIVDSIMYNMPVPGASPTKVYTSADAPVLGISVGWADLYRDFLPGQWADVTGLPSGQYWLEVIIDPYDRVLESDETNNTTRILVDLDIPQPMIHPGDYNDDGVVDAADYTVWRDTLGAVVEWGAAADGNGDGVITASDYDVWVAHFGETAGGSSLVATVPEPTAGVLVLLALGLILFRRKSCERLNRVLVQNTAVASSPGPCVHG